MKKISTLILSICSVLGVAQSESRYYNSWRFGLNIGGMWQTADVRSTAGVGGGFTLEKGILENKTRFFSLAIRGRGLFGNTYGLDYSRNYDVKNNPALNGTYNSSVNYNDSAKSKPYIYNNYKTQINEGALELQISFNRLRERTNVLLNLWGGVGITSYRVNTNLLDVDGKMYNYSKVDSVGGNSSILSSHKNLLDHTYESYANGSKRNNLITFSPSAGIGLGYKFSDHFSIIYEYKVTFPQGINADYLDGIVGKNNDRFAKSKDYYHYTGINLLFRIGKGKTKSTTNTTTSNTAANTYQPVQTNTVVATQPTNTLNVNQVTNNVPVLQKPIVDFTNPSSSPYNEKRDANFNVSANVFHVSNRSQINVTVNGFAFTNFNYSGNSVSFPVSLIIGNNVITISASNSAGSDSETAVINYSGNPPQIVYTYPSNNPFATTNPELNVNATISNVVSNYDVSVKWNGNPLSNYNFSTINGQLSAQLSLVPGSNQLEINATNPFGSDNEKLIVNYTQPINSPTTTLSRPVKVTITNPGPNYKASANSQNVNATVTGVTSSSQVTVTVNGVNTAFNYLNGAVDFMAGLNEGANTAVVSAKNNTSSDSKSVVIYYEIIRKNPPPSVVIVNPQPSPYTTNKTDYDFKAQTYLVSNLNEIEVKYNGSVVTNYSFSSATGIINFNGNLIPNTSNVFDVKVSTASGSKSASATVIQQTIVNTEIGVQTKEICHKVGKLQYQTITITEAEWPQHQAHGDYEGKCNETPGNPEGGLDPDLIICHKTPNGQQTITIKQSEWQTHQAHGDYQGACTKQAGSTTNPDVDPDITICHNDGNGGKQTLTIKQSQWTSHQAHGDEMGVCPRIVNIEEEKITICHIPPGNNSNPQTIQIPVSAWPVHQAHGDYKGVCTKQTGSTVNPDNDPDITICHNDGNGGKQTLTIKQSQWTSHQAHGDEMGVCPRIVNIEEEKITICHIPPGNNSNPQTIQIPVSAWPAHQAHGDSQGACATATTGAGQAPEGGGPGPTTSKKITICHIPPGNNSNPQTIEISESAWPAHQAHGDSKGECPQQKIINSGGNGQTKELKTEENNQNQTGRPVQPSSEPQSGEIKVGRPR